MRGPKRSSDAIMPYKELCRSVAFRIAQVNLEMDEQNILRMANRALEVLPKVQNLPTYSQVISMTHKELNHNLQ